MSTMTPDEWVFFYAAFIHPALVLSLAVGAVLFLHRRDFRRWEEENRRNGFKSGFKDRLATHRERARPCHNGYPKCRADGRCDRK
jgi:hypothetical protein